MQLQIAMNILYDMMMQSLHCLCNVHDQTTPLICQWMISCYTLPNIFSYHNSLSICIFCKCHERNLVWNWYGSMEDCLPFHSWNLPFHSSIFHIPYENFHSVSYHALLTKAKAAWNWNAKTGSNKDQYSNTKENSTKANQEQTMKNRAFLFLAQSRVNYGMYFFLFC